MEHDSTGLHDCVPAPCSRSPGILRIAKESNCSGSNNLEVGSQLSPKNSQSFGLLDREIESVGK